MRYDLKQRKFFLEMMDSGLSCPEIEETFIKRFPGEEGKRSPGFAARYYRRHDPEEAVREETEKSQEPQDRFDPARFSEEWQAAVDALTRGRPVPPKPEKPRKRARREPRVLKEAPHGHIW